MLHYYPSMTVQGVRKMPLITFWMLSRNIDRITAEQDIRRGRVSMMVQSSEGFTKLMEELQGQMGTVVKFDEGKRAMLAKRDVINKEGKAALNALGDMSNVSSR